MLFILILLLAFKIPTIKRWCCKRSDGLPPSAEFVQHLDGHWDLIKIHGNHYIFNKENNYILKY